MLCNPLDIISPTTIIRIIIYPDICDSKISWDKTLQYWIVRKWESWEKKLSVKVIIPRTSNLIEEILEMINIYVFGYACLLGTCGVAYAVKRPPPTISDKNYG